LGTVTCFLCDGQFQLRAGDKTRYRHPVCKQCRDDTVDLVCEDCRRSFVFPVKDRIFYKQQGFSPPKRCEACRRAKKDRKQDNGGGLFGGIFRGRFRP